MTSPSRLTPAQRGLLSRERLISDKGEPFILLHTYGDDRVARALEAKGLGTFQGFRSQYSWRRRDGYTSNFWPKEDRVQEALSKR